MDLERIKYYILAALASVIALTVHEVCHGYAAYKLGDNTAKNMGRLSLNPLKHLDPIGALCMIFFHIGWAKPVPINARNFKNPKRDFAICAAAGPLSNLIMGFFGAALYILAHTLLLRVQSSDSEFLFNLAFNTRNFLSAFFVVNIGLGLFNLIPIPPFDGSRILHLVLPEKTYFEIMKYERYIYYFMLGWLFLGDNVAAFLRSIPFISNSAVLYTVVGIFGLGDMISAANNFVATAILNFWQLIF